MRRVCTRLEPGCKATISPPKSRLEPLSFLKSPDLFEEPNTMHEQFQVPKTPPKGALLQYAVAFAVEVAAEPPDSQRHLMHGLDGAFEWNASEFQQKPRHYAVRPNTDFRNDKA